MTDHEKYKEWREKHREIHEEKPCRHCKGTGYIQVEPGSTTVYPCPDCNSAEAEEEMGYE